MLGSIRALGRLLAISRAGKPSDSVTDSKDRIHLVLFLSPRRYVPAVLASVIPQAITTFSHYCRSEMRLLAFKESMTRNTHATIMNPGLILGQGWRQTINFYFWGNALDWRWFSAKGPSELFSPWNSRASQELTSAQAAQLGVLSCCCRGAVILRETAWPCWLG